MSNNNASESSLYVKAINKGVYLAFFLLAYDYNFQEYRYSSPYIPVGQSFKIPIPYGAIEIWFHGFMWGPVRILSSGVGVTDRPLCYEFEGTIFNPSCDRLISCPPGDNGSDSNCTPCCCNCCNCCCNPFCK